MRLWDPDRARESNGCAEPVDRKAAMRDEKGWKPPAWSLPAVMPQDLRRPEEDDPDDPRLHPENFPPERRWANYLAGWRNQALCLRVDAAIGRGECVALGCSPGTYSVDQILAQMAAAR